MSAQAYLFDTRVPVTTFTSKPVSRQTPAAMPGFYALAVPEIDATIYKPIKFEPEVEWPDDHHLALCLRAVDAAITEAEKCAADDVKAFVKRYGRSELVPHAERVQEIKKRDMQKALSDPRIAVGKMFGSWTINGPARISTDYSNRTKVVRCVCVCGTQKEVVAATLLSGKSYRCVECFKKMQRAGKA